MDVAGSEAGKRGSKNRAVGYNFLVGDENRRNI